MDETVQPQTEVAPEKEEGVFYGTPITDFVKPPRDVPPSAQQDSDQFLYGAPIAEQPEKEINPVPSMELGSELSAGYLPPREEKPKPDYPDAPTIAEMPGLGKSAYAATLSDDPNLVARAILRDVPNAEYKIDSAGFPYMQMPAPEGQEKGPIYYLDKPGFNLLDFGKLFTRGALSIPTGIAAAGAFAAGPAAGIGAMGAAGAADAAIRQRLLKSLTGEETFDPTEIAVEGGISAGIPVAGTIGRKALGWAGVIVDADNLWNALPRGVKNRLDALVANAEKRGGVQIGSEAGDILLDDPNWFGAAKSIMRQDTDASQQLAEALMQRQAGTQSRIDDAVTAAFGPMKQDKRAIKEMIELPKVQASEELNTALKEATQKGYEVKVRDIVQELDSEISTAKGPIRSALMSVRNMLMNPEREAQLMTGPGPTRSVIFETRPEAIDNARQAIAGMMKNGFAEGMTKVSPRELNKSRILGDINTKLSDKLKEIPGVEKSFKTYETMYKQKEAVDFGYNFMGTANNPVSPNEVQRFLAKNPDMRQFVEAGAKLRIDDMLGTSPNDLAAIKKAAKGEKDFSRQNLEIIFNDKDKTKVSGIVDFAEKEAKRKANADALLAESKRAREGTQASIMLETKTPSEDLTNRYVWAKKALEFAPNVWRGTRGSAYESGMADLMTKSRKELDDILKAKGVANEQARAKLIDDLRRGAVGRSFVAPAATLDEAQQQANGGRTAYKSGGRVKNARSVAEALMREIDQTRKLIGKKTEDILSMPDDAVATALKIARGNV
jgi:hypothetical protein